jgi:hypothetical protein
VSVEVVTNGLRGCKQSGAPYEVAFVRRDGEFFMLLIASLQRVRSLLEELAIPSEAIEVVRSIDEDGELMLAEVTGRAMVLPH